MPLEVEIAALRASVEHERRSTADANARAEVERVQAKGFRQEKAHMEVFSSPVVLPRSAVKMGVALFCCPATTCRCWSS